MHWCMRWYMKRLSVTSFSLENNLMFRLTLMMTGAFSRNVGKLFSELKLVTDNLLFIYAEANWEATENSYSSISSLKYSNSATELPGDSVAQLVTSWLAICRVMGQVPPWVIVIYHSHLYFSLFILFKVWPSGLEHVYNWGCVMYFTFIIPPLTGNHMLSHPWQVGCGAHSHSTQMICTTLATPRCAVQHSPRPPKDHTFFKGRLLKQV